MCSSDNLEVIDAIDAADVISSDGGKGGRFGAQRAAAVIAVAVFTTAALVLHHSPFIGAVPPRLMTVVTEEACSIGFCGDTFFDRLITNSIGESGDPFQYVRPVLAGSTYNVCNLETPVLTGGRPVPHKAFTFESAPEYLRYLTGAGIGIVNLANNHAADRGMDGLAATFSNLECRGILYTGAGTNLAHATRPVILATNGVRIGVLSFVENPEVVNYYARPDSPGLSELDTNAMAGKVSALRGSVDFVVVILHWGTEYSDAPDGRQRGIARLLAESGADLVVGGHPHVLQGIERFGRTVVFYSIGNFLFVQRERIKTRYSLIPRVRIVRDVLSGRVTNLRREVDFTPVMIRYDDYLPQTAGADDAPEIIGHMEKLSAGLDGGMVFRRESASNSTRVIVE